MSMYRSEEDQIAMAADVAQVRSADAAEEQARASVEAAEAAKAAAEASKATARWTLWIAIVMAVSVLADIIFRLISIPPR